MNFEKHAFISYAHNDNLPLSESEEGWISDFHSTLNAILIQKSGDKVDIWRDNKLNGNDIFSEEIVDQFPKTALLISVLTPSYLKSEWCEKELKAFYKSASENIGISIGNKSRILKVLKTPVERDEIPSEISDTLGYEFYKKDENGREKEFTRGFGDEYAKAYLKKVDDLAFDINKTLEQLKKKKEKAEVEKPDKASTEDSKKIKSIYVAQTSYDLKEHREQIVRELRSHGYQVFPNKTLSSIEDEFTNEVVEKLEECQLAIHLIGKTYGGIPDGPSQKSASSLQNEITAAKSKLAGLKRIIWMPQNIQISDEKQQQFVKELNESEEAHFGADVIEGTIEDLKAVMFEKIQQIENPIKKKDITLADDEKNIFLICDARDRELTKPLRKHLISKNCEITIPLFEGEPKTIRQDMEENLKNCDAIIIFYGKGDESWLRSKKNDLKKLKSYKRTKDLLASYIYLADPVTLDKEEHIELGIPNVINGLNGFSANILENFMNDVAQSK